MSSISHCSSSSEEEECYTDCGRTYSCGDLKNISYPFWGTDFRPPTCSREGFEIECRNNNQSLIQINDQQFRILGINQTAYGMKIARTDLLESDSLYNQNAAVAITLNYTLFDYAPSTVYYTTDERFLSTPDSASIQKYCKPFQVPVLWTSNDENPDGIGKEEVEPAVREGLDVDYSHQLTFVCNECERSGGRCGSNATNDGFLCYCLNDKPQNIMCPPAAAAKKKKNSMWCAVVPTIVVTSKTFPTLSGELISDPDTAVGNIMKIARSDLYDTLCIQNDVVPVTLNYTHFDYAPNVGNLTLIYGCQKPLSSLHNLTCYLGNEANQTIYYKADDPFSNIEIPFGAPRSCKPVKVPVLRSSIDMNSPEVGREELEKAVEEGFDVDYNYQVAILCKECEGSGGRCGSNVTTDEFLCYCHKSKPYTVMCRPGVTAAAVAILLACVIICVVRCKKSSTKFFSKMTKSDKDIEETVYYANDSSPRILQGCRGKITVTIFWTALNSSGSGMDKVQEALNLGYDRCRIQVLRGDL
ncbi:hypothetical protein FEM48_Zijuj05G0095500 [Ziziphus jujuba var. spinosa]|uniref:non-specific serine/threonine protein kinase n=1 Tax=Ziziphus jujuba var. spinosa TaxID=714518 RepID=A0A978VE69_ZIZJJ|nr:hypothetical protein FEM48_Zijuj05G0095500 [Ziziphus jujuba var. spinosa]